MKYFVVTFGCAANVADSQRIAGYYRNRGWRKAKSPETADEVVIVTCMVRQSAEDRVVGLVNNLRKEKEKGKRFRIIITGCMTGMAIRDKSGKLLKILKKRMPDVDEFTSIEEIGFSHPQIRTDKRHALVSISNGCNNFCSYCVVPYSRGREVSRSFEEIIKECKELAKSGYTYITLLGQNVNSYGSDFLTEKLKTPGRWPDGLLPGEKKITYVKHLGKMRIPTLFPHVLNEICKIDGLKHIDFLSSNPWDFSDDLIDVIAKNPKIGRQIHLPVQSGDDEVLKRMNRWYTAKEYIKLIQKIRDKIPDGTFSTDIIVGFPGETEEQFQHTVDLCKKVGFVKAYVAMYSDRLLTYAHTHFRDALPYQEKKRRWGRLERLIYTNNK
ncbi:MAG: (Dimethylallyl)adenosine tRNA methylthiotransferase MiaB [Candidatus Gottesmanbacteria bacterium GW2011_GWB1_44_11c]|uniref:tRNA-2-methylthio-N(6)-dimethylallyladenosine synthase n=3 Tax=Candidatus Gottesmaniibacteriota TaxID=1752720 RepID=A0A0G1JTA2_9BACT|nr:MAG: (Dimethylallyl)adenosine tRNA methylthiotransferase MiaB [Candidatus Gottesmanbacteria bacterium GW2011_GWB1_44_11c]